MTHLKLIKIYLEGFQAARYEQIGEVDCPYQEGEKAWYWRKGHLYASFVNQILAKQTAAANEAN